MFFRFTRILMFLLILTAEVPSGTGFILRDQQKALDDQRQCLEAV